MNKLIIVALVLLIVWNIKLQREINSIKSEGMTDGACSTANMSAISQLNDLANELRNGSGTITVPGNNKLVGGMWAVGSTNNKDNADHVDFGGGP